MKKTLHVGKNFILPVEAVTQTFAGLAKRRVGKTYTFSVMAEEFVAAKLPFVALDPTGAWWGIRASANGKGPGLPVIVIGGRHGDIPLNPDEGKLIADVVVDNPGYYVLDLSLTKSNAEQDRFATDFAERLYRRKQEVRDPLHLFVDEADAFLPQRPFPGQQRMLGAFETLVRRGGICGIGVSLISQRAAVINKNVLSQVEVLIVLQTTGPHDRAAIKDWAMGHGTKEQVDELMSSLAGLKQGEAWVWSPSWLDVFKRVKIRERRTFNSSATPKVGQRQVEPKRMADVDIEALKKRLSRTIEKAKDSDPVELRRQVIGLRSEIARLQKQKPDPAPEPQIKIGPRKVIKVSVLKDVHIKRLEKLAQRQRDASGDFQACLIKIGEIVTAAHPVALDFNIDKAVSAAKLKALPRPAPGVHIKVVKSPGQVGPIVENLGHRKPIYDRDFKGNGSVKSGSGESRMLEALARRHPNGLSRHQIATLSGMSPTSGTFTTYLSRLRKNGYIEERSWGTILTESGQQAGAQWLGQVQSIDEVRAMWKGNLGGTVWRMVELLIQVDEKEPHQFISRQELGILVGMSHTSGTFTTYLSRLRRNGLIEEENGHLRVSRNLLEKQVAVN